MLETNLQVQKRSNIKPVVGDVFTVKVPDGTHLFGRVIGAELPSGRAPMPGANLLYLYDVRSALPQPDFADLVPSRLLIPPYFTNRMLWTKGYAVNIASPELTTTDLLAQHCFRDWLRKRYCDENGQPLAQRYEPCGSWGLGSYRKFDDLVSDALGIERVPLQPGDPF